MFPTFGRGERTGQKVPRHAKNFLKWRIYPIADKLKIPRKLVHLPGVGAPAQSAQILLRHFQIVHASLSVTRKIKVPAPFAPCFVSLQYAC